MSKKIGIGLVVVLAIAVAIVATRPSEFHIERSKTIAAPADVVFLFVNDFHDWPSWSPWEKLDPQMQKSHSGAPLGKGAVYEWSGNDQVGKGRMTIKESRPNQLVGIQLEFMEPWTATNDTTFTFHGSGSTTKLTWAMDGENDFMAKAFSLFMDMDALVGKDFETGLDALAKVAAAEAEKRRREVSGQ